MNDILKEKLKLKIAISKIKMEKNMNKKTHLIFKNLGIAACTIICLTGGAFAGNQIIESIWKTPEKVKCSSDITEDIRNVNISLSEAKLKAIEVLEKFNFNTNIVEYKEIKDTLSDEITYSFFTDDNYQVNIEGKSGNFYDMWNNNHFVKDTNKLISDKEALEISNQYCIQYGINLDEYEVTKVWVGNDPSISKGSSDIISIGYNKKVNDIINPFDYISVSIRAGNSLDSFRIDSIPFDNNEIILSKEDAISKALEEDKRIETNEIEKVDAKLQIVKMNSAAFERINNKEEYYKPMQSLDYDPSQKNYYNVDERIRNAWVVTITYVDNYNKDIVRRYTEGKFSYFVDSTTGEIIGGDTSYAL